MEKNKNDLILLIILASITLFLIICVYIIEKRYFSIQNGINYDEKNVVNQQMSNETRNVSSQENVNIIEESINTKETTTDFEYLFKLKPNNEKSKNCKYEDIVTIYLVDWHNDMPKTYLIDLKGKKMYYGVGPYDPSDTNDYKNQKDLSNQKIKEIINSIKNVNIHNWEESYKGENIGTGSFSWSMIIEYKNGIIEYHSGHGMGSAPKGYNDIEETFEDIKNK